MSRVFWDTNLFIYLFEDYGELSESVSQLRRRMIARRDQLYASALTLGELLVKPIEKGNESLAISYQNALAQAAVILPFDGRTAVHYARIRGDRTIKAPDAMQLSCAAEAEIDVFITNDNHLSGKIIPGIQFIVPLSGAFL